MDVMEEKNFQYIENFVCIELSPTLAEQIVNDVTLHIKEILRKKK
jgi:hypothetical protein